MSKRDNQNKPDKSGKSRDVGKAKNKSNKSDKSKDVGEAKKKELPLVKVDGLPELAGQVDQSQWKRKWTERDLAEKPFFSKKVVADIINVYYHKGEQVVAPEYIVLEHTSAVGMGEKSLTSFDRDGRFGLLDSEKKFIKHRFGFEYQTANKSDMLIWLAKVNLNEISSMPYPGKGGADDRYTTTDNLVLFFSWGEHWSAAKSFEEYALRDAVHGEEILAERKNETNAFSYEVMEVAWLPDEVIGQFRSDFRHVAKLLSIIRKKYEENVKKAQSLGDGDGDGEGAVKTEDLRELVISYDLDGTIDSPYALAHVLYSLTGDRRFIDFILGGTTVNGVTFKDSPTTVQEMFTFIGQAEQDRMNQLQRDNDRLQNALEKSILSMRGFVEDPTEIARLCGCPDSLVQEVLRKNANQD